MGEEGSLVRGGKEASWAERWAYSEFSVDVKDSANLESGGTVGVGVLIDEVEESVGVVSNDDSREGVSKTLTSS
jgi:hypothetical protein